jgi:hypothetical protein
LGTSTRRPEESQTTATMRAFAMTQVGTSLWSRRRSTPGPYEAMVTVIAALICTLVVDAVKGAPPVEDGRPARARVGRGDHLRAPGT